MNFRGYKAVFGLFTLDALLFDARLSQGSRGVLSNIESRRRMHHSCGTLTHYGLTVVQLGDSDICIHRLILCWEEKTFHFV